MNAVFKIAFNYHNKYIKKRGFHLFIKKFWRWAKERLVKHHGVSPKNLPLYLKELEFWYQCQHTDIFGKGADYLCDLVP
jgi:transposase